MRDFNFESLKRVNEAHSRIQRILENRNNIINNNMYDVKENNNLIIRINELLLESFEALQKLPTEVSQYTIEFLEKNGQVYETNVKERQQAYEISSKAICDESDKLIEINNELHRKINLMHKINKVLSITCGLLIGLLIALITTIIILKT